MATMTASRGRRRRPALSQRGNHQCGPLDSFDHVSARRTPTRSQIRLNRTGNRDRLGDGIHEGCSDAHNTILLRLRHEPFHWLRRQALCDMPESTCHAVTATHRPGGVIRGCMPPAVRRPDERSIWRVRGGLVEIGLISDQESDRFSVPDDNVALLQQPGPSGSLSTRRRRRCREKGRGSTPSAPILSWTNAARGAWSCSRGHIGPTSQLVALEGLASFVRRSRGWFSVSDARLRSPHGLIIPTSSRHLTPARTAAFTSWRWSLSRARISVAPFPPAGPAD